MTVLSPGGFFVLKGKGSLWSCFLLSPSLFVLDGAVLWAVADNLVTK